MIYSFRDFIKDKESLIKSLKIGKRYEFSDCLQSEKRFKVEWIEAELTEVKQINGSANCFIADHYRAYLFVRELCPINSALDLLAQKEKVNYFLHKSI